MSDRFSIEVGKQTVGIAIRTGEGFRFFAALPRFFALEGKSYPSIRAVSADANAIARARGVNQPVSAEIRPAAPVPANEAAAPAPAFSRRISAGEDLEQPPEWFRWAVLAGVTAGPAALAAAAAALAG